MFVQNVFVFSFCFGGKINLINYDSVGVFFSCSACIEYRENFAEGTINVGFQIR